METIVIVILVVILFLFILYFSRLSYKLFSTLFKIFFIITCALLILWAIIMKGIIPSTSDGILQILFAIFGMGFLYAGIVCGAITTLILIVYLVSLGINKVKGGQNSTSVKVFTNTRSLPASTSQ